MSTAPADPHLHALYGQARYRIIVGSQQLCVHLDRNNPQLRPYLADEANLWALVGAVNPMSKLYPSALNTRRHRHFERALRRRSIVFHQASGSSADDSWHESALWLSGSDLTTATLFGFRYAQAAIVVGCGTGPARLHWLRQSV